MNDESWLQHIPSSKCPTCGYILNAVVEKGSPIAPVPREGDITMCIECYTPMLFNADLSVRLLNSMEHMALGEIVNEMTNQLIFAKRNYSRMNKQNKEYRKYYEARYKNEGFRNKRKYETLTGYSHKWYAVLLLWRRSY